MGLSASWDDSLDYYCLADSKNKFLGINPIGISDPREDSLEIITLQEVKKLLVINPMVLSDPRDYSLGLFP